MIWRQWRGKEGGKGTKKENNDVYKYADAIDGYDANVENDDIDGNNAGADDDDDVDNWQWRSYWWFQNLW